MGLWIDVAMKGVDDYLDKTRLPAAGDKPKTINAGNPPPPDTWYWRWWRNSSTGNKIMAGVGILGLFALIVLFIRKLAKR